MKKKNLLGLLSVLLLLLSPVLAGCNSKSEVHAESDSITLKYSFFAPPSTFPGLQMQKWKEELEKRTNGKVKVELYPGGTLLQANNMLDGVNKGVTDIGLFVTSADPGRFPLLAIADIAKYPNSKVATRVKYDLIHEYQKEEFEDNKIITAFTGEPSHIQSVTPITSLEEIKGKQLRISGALAPILEEMGAAPVGMSQAEAAESLQLGIIEGVVTSREILKDFQFAELVNYITDYPLNVNTFVAVMSKDKWNSLPDDVKIVIDELSFEMAKWTSEYHDNHVQESVDWSIKEKGIEVVSLSKEEREKWEEIVLKMREEYVQNAQSKGLPAEEFEKRMDELIKKYNNNR